MSYYDESSRSSHGGGLPNMSESRSKVLSARAAAGWQRAIEKMSTPSDASMSQFGKSPDVADMLPDDIGIKLLAMRDMAEDAYAAFRGLDEAHQHAQTRVHETQIRLRGLTDPDAMQRVGNNPVLLQPSEGGEEHPAIVDARGKLAAAQADLAKINERREVLAHRQQQAQFIIDRAERYLAANWQGKPFDAYEGKLRKFASAEAARAEIANIKAALDAAYSAPCRSSDVKATVRAQVAALAARGAPNVQAAINHGQEVIWPKAAVHVEQYVAPDAARAHIVAKSPDTLGLLAWCFKDQLIAALDAEIDKTSDDTGALSEDDRNTKITQLTDDLLAAERAEVQLVDAAGLDHRQDVDARALLGIDGPEGE
ncbi:hypothetical protein NKI89_07175 [Mesorhizobium sp. M0309]|uniref:hypothetical protein n=1 Tax=Mesorhizobium sp. M0309 TaxID=2956933 RepID=UPI0033358690